MLGSATVMLLALATVNAMISPKMAQVEENGTLKVTCNFPGRQLDECLFGIHFTGTGTARETEVINLSQGKQSLGKVHTIGGSTEQFEIAYIGEGLLKGECGMNLSRLSEGRYFVGCQVLPKDGVWIREYMAIMVLSDGLPFTSNESYSLHLLSAPDGLFTLSFNARVRLQQCKVYLPTSESFLLNKDSQGNEGSPKVTGRSYEGRLRGSTCLVTRRTSWTGLVWVQYREVGSQDWKVLPPQIVVDRENISFGGLRVETAESTETDLNPKFNATCIVPNASPPTTFRWTLGDKVLREDDDVHGRRWTWPWDVIRITQTLSFVLPEARESTLTCRVTWPDEDTEVISEWNQVVRGRNAGKPDTLAPVADNDRGCFALAPPSSRVQCSLHGVNVDCTITPVPQGTTARLDCRPGFRSLPNHPKVQESICKENGWRPRVTSCLLDCGVRGASKNELIAGGSDAGVGEFPWHVALYRSEGDDRYTLDCGGTLISRTLVVTAAHCFWSESVRSLKNHTQYKMAAGKHLRDWSEQEVKKQIRDVAEIQVPARYRGRSSNLQYDIAVVRVSEPFDFTTVVKPVCLDWGGQHTRKHMQQGAKGTVAGWGASETGRYHEQLQIVDLPYVDFNTCFSSLPENAERFFTDDKFCAGVANSNRSVCKGDSGGGLIFATDSRYYLQGIVSVGFAPADYRGNCYSQQYTGFTVVSQYLSWIKSLVDA